MTPLTAEWVGKAEGDFKSARRELRARTEQNHDSACYHAQQCIEKYLKALLQEAAIPFPKTHNLVALFDLAAPTNPRLTLSRVELADLTLYGVEYRYPGKTADKPRALQALALCRKIRRSLRGALGLPPN
jgi:HEPN domain-containing protein